MGGIVGRGRDADGGQSSVTTASGGRHRHPRFIARSCPRISVGGITAHSHRGGSACLRQQNTARRKTQHAGRLHTDDSLVAYIKGIAAIGTRTATSRIEGSHSEIAVIVATPSPVDAELAAGIIAMKHEGMSCGVVESCVRHRTACINLVFQQLYPCRVGIVAFTDSLQSGTIIKIILQCILHAISIGAADERCRTAIIAIFHLDRDSHMVAQGSHCIDLRRTTAAAEAVGHVGPVIVRRAKVGTLGSKTASIGMRSYSHRRVVPVFHHLGHGDGRASRRGIGRTQIVVIRALVPRGGEHRGHCLTGLWFLPRATEKHPPLRLNILTGLGTLFHQIVYFFFILIEPETHIVAHLAGRMAHRIAEHRIGTIVSTDDDKTFPLVYVKDIEAVESGILHQSDISTDTLATFGEVMQPESFGHTTCLVKGHRCCQ